jgi:hypothetical protein
MVTAYTDVLTFFPPGEGVGFKFHLITYVCVLIRAFVVDQNLILSHPCHTLLLELGEIIFKFHFYIL